jgi:hypothetical protein
MDDSGALLFVLLAGLAATMALVYVPLRIFLTGNSTVAPSSLASADPSTPRRAGSAPLSRILMAQAITMPPSTWITCPVM